MFEKATRLKLRFETAKGALTVEQLWDLPLTVANCGISLDNIAKALFRALKQCDEVDSFVNKTSKPNELLKLKFDIVKHIIDVRLAEEERAEQAKLAKDRNQQILAAIAQQESAQLLATPIEELKKMLKEE